MPPHVGLNEARLQSARTFLLTSVAETRETARVRGELTQDELVTIRMASTWAIQSAREVVATLYGAGYRRAIRDNRRITPPAPVRLGIGSTRMSHVRRAASTSASNPAPLWNRQ